MSLENNEAENTQDREPVSAASLKEKELRNSMREFVRALYVDMTWRFSGLMEARSQDAKKQPDDSDRTSSSPPG